MGRPCSQAPLVVSEIECVRSSSPLCSLLWVSELQCCCCCCCVRVGRWDGVRGVSLPQNACSDFRLRQTTVKSGDRRRPEAVSVAVPSLDRTLRSLAHEPNGRSDFSVLEIAGCWLFLNHQEYSHLVLVSVSRRGPPGGAILATFPGKPDTTFGSPAQCRHRIPIPYWNGVLELRNGTECWSDWGSRHHSGPSLTSGHFARSLQDCHRLLLLLLLLLHHHCCYSRWSWRAGTPDHSREDWFAGRPLVQGEEERGGRHFA